MSVCSILLRIRSGYSTNKLFVSSKPKFFIDFLSKELRLLGVPNLFKGIVSLSLPI